MKTYVPKRMARTSWKIVLLFGLFLLPLLLFAKIADSIAEGEHFWLDEATLRVVHGYSNPFLDRVIPVITAMGGPAISTGMVIVSAGVLLYKKYRWQATLLLAGTGGAALANLVLKGVLHRPRPDLWAWIVTESNYSFPSGHAMVSAALAASMIVILWRTKWRALSIVVGVSYVLLIGFTRLYLGVHYPSDILGGWTAGVAWVVLVYIVLRRYALRSMPASDE